MQKAKKNVRSLTFEELSDILLEWGEKKFRSKQVYEWIWKNKASSFEEMNNLSHDLRSKLSEYFSLEKVSIDHVAISKDGTRKYMLKLPGGQKVEGVLIPTETRVTACVSSQVGCSLACSFCATGRLQMTHNLHYSEIYDEVAVLNEESIIHFEKPLSNIVYMGMGEPLLNYKNVCKSIEMISSPDGMGMSPRRITVSSAGIAKMIRKMGDDEVKFEFALSLHAANDEKRNKIMGINETNTLDNLKEAILHYQSKTNKRITLEYCVFNNFNDSRKDALELLDFCRAVPSKINIIEYNPISGGDFENTTKPKMREFVQILENGKAIVNIRKSRGKDIDGACGQLALKQ